MRSSVFVFSVVLLHSLPLAAELPPIDDLQSEALDWRAEEEVWRPDGSWIAYVWKEGGEKQLRAFDAAKNDIVWKRTRTELVPAGETEPIEPDEIAWSPRGDALLVVAGGDLFLQTLDAASPRRLTRTDAEEEHAVFSPDGGKLAFSRAADLWVIDLESGAETRLTEDGIPDEILNGTTDWVYWEEIWDRDAEAIWWSPDSRTLAFYRFDERGVPRYPILDDRGREAKLRWQPYPTPGAKNPAVTIGIVDLPTRAVRFLDTSSPEESYLARVHWRLDGSAVAVERLNRDQTRLDLLLCDPDRGSCVTLATQAAKTWVSVTRDFAFRRDGGFVWGADDEGWWRIYLYDRLGRRLRPISPEGWAVGELFGLYGIEQEVAVVSAFRTGPLGAAQRNILAIDLLGGETKTIGDGDGWHEALVAPNGRVWLHTWSNLETPPRKTIEGIEGTVLATFPGAPAWPKEILDLPPGEILEIPGPQGVRLPARLIKPARFDPKKKYPVLMHQYGGPGSQVVANEFDGRWARWLRWMAARGYGVLFVDNPASAFFGKRGEDRLHRRFGELELAAQLAGVEFLRTQAWADTSRLGIEGYSGGGANALYSILHSPGTWKAAAAGAPVTDWRTYDSVWTERYLDSPDANPEGYEQSSTLHAAANLKDHLLLVHGTVDDNVHPQNSIALSAKLVELGKPFEQAFYPGEKHSLQRVALRHYQTRMAEFFDRYLRPAER